MYFFFLTCNTSTSISVAADDAVVVVVPAVVPDVAAAAAAATVAAVRSSSPGHRLELVAAISLCSRSGSSTGLVNFFVKLLSNLRENCVYLLNLNLIFQQILLFEVLQGKVHRRVVRNAGVVSAHEVVEAAERAVLHPHGSHHHDVGPGEGIPQQEGSILQVPLDVIFVVAVRFHLFRNVLQNI